MNVRELKEALSKLDDNEEIRVQTGWEFGCAVYDGIDRMIDTFTGHKLVLEGAAEKGFLWNYEVSYRGPYDAFDAPPRTVVLSAPSQEWVVRNLHKALSNVEVISVENKGMTEESIKRLGEQIC